MKSNNSYPGRLVLITGGAGYIGSVLTQQLLARGVQVRSLDAQVFGDGLADLTDPRLEDVRGDIRDPDVFHAALKDVDTVVHLAAVANDPSFDLDPQLGRSVNYECLHHIMKLSEEAGVRRFIYASSASVYGISDAPEVDEGQPLVPVTDYNRYKALGEQLLFSLNRPDFETVAVRSATVCGVSPRQRLDLTVNLLTAQAVLNGRITVFGGKQFRPNVHVEDLVSVYTRLICAESLGPLSGLPVNVGNENLTVSRIAEVVAAEVREKTGRTVETVTTPTNDVRSYRLTSRRLHQTTGIMPSRNVAYAAEEVATAILDGKLPNALADPRYYNVRLMKSLGATV